MSTAAQTMPAYFHAYLNSRLNRQYVHTNIMPADKKVSIGWQIVFTFFPIVNFWAFYRIRRLRKYVLYIIVPEIIIGTVLGAYTSSAFIQGYPNTGFEGSADAFDISTNVFEIFSNPVIIGLYAFSLALQGLTIYLIVIWSRQHNRQYDQPAMQQRPSG